MFYEVFFSRERRNVSWAWVIMTIVDFYQVIYIVYATIAKRKEKRILKFKNNEECIEMLNHSLLDNKIKCKFQVFAVEVESS